MKKFLLAAAMLFFPKLAFAHCPLCTAGAGALAVVASYLGLSSVVVGVLIGAFAIALSLWISNIWPKKEYFRFQKLAVNALIFLGTIVPITPLIRDYAPLYVPFWGPYGRTIAVNEFLAGVPIGVLIILVSPALSRWLSRMRQGRMLPYQGLSITFLLLILASLIIQFV